MPLNPIYVQEVSKDVSPSGLPKHTYVNISSQMMNPEGIHMFFKKNNTAVKMEDVDVTQTSLHNYQAPEQNLTDFFEQQAPSKFSHFRTGSMKAWNVQKGLTELRADDFS